MFVGPARTVLDRGCLSPGSSADTPPERRGDSTPSAAVEPPPWFTAFEHRMDRKLDSLKRGLFQVVGEVKEALAHHEHDCAEKLSNLKKELEKCE